MNSFVFVPLDDDHVMWYNLGTEHEVPVIAYMVMLKVVALKNQIRVLITGQVEE